VEDSAVAAGRQAVGAGTRDMRALTAVRPTPPPPVCCTAVQLMAEPDDAALQVTAGERAVAACMRRSHVRGEK